MCIYFLLRFSIVLYGSINGHLFTFLFHIFCLKKLRWNGIIVVTYKSTNLLNTLFAEYPHNSFQFPTLSAFFVIYCDLF